MKRLMWMLGFVLACKTEAVVDAGAGADPSASSASKVVASASASPSPSASAKAPVDPFAAFSTLNIVREEKTVTVDGVAEQWRFEWLKPPTTDCVQSDAACTCPCAGFAFGEKGELDLVRVRAGSPDERLHLSPLFEGGVARLRRWPVTDNDATRCLADASAPDISSLAVRPLTSVMKLADYDHDGRATELVLQIDAGPCGHQRAIVVGISKSNPHLHAFGTAEAPAEPLELDHLSDWEKVLTHASSTLVEYPCGDHGSDTERSIVVSANGDLHAKAATKKCAVAYP